MTSPEGRAGPASSAPRTDFELAVMVAEQHRARARSVATLLATAAGALLTGLTLQTTSTLPAYARWVALLAGVGLLVATGIYVKASTYVGTEEFEENRLAEQTDALIRAIHHRTNVGWRWAVGASSALVLAISYTLLPFRLEDNSAVISLTRMGLAKVQRVCPNVTPEVRVDRIESLSSTDPLITLYVPEKVCAADAPSYELVVARSDIAAVIAE